MDDRMKTKAITVAFLAVVLTAVVAQEVAIDRESLRLGGQTYSPYVGRSIPDRVYWGDTHLHTSYSTDAGMIGNYLGPDEAYQFARGEEVTASGGLRAKLIRPLDFLVVADHSENLGLAPLIEESNPKLLQNEFGRKVHDLVKAGKVFEAYGAWGRALADRQDPIADNELAASIWERITAAAEEHNDPGRFTALIGFEWTSSFQANNLHRVVIFRDSADEANQILPLSNYDSDDPEDLWRFLEEYESKTGGRALAIPHNGNLSNGLMFAAETLDGKPIDRDYAQRRMRWEPLYEITQMKGDGEAHPYLSPNDEFADYGTWDKTNFGTQVKTRDMLEFEYARSALKNGLQFERKLGLNPFKFGVIGSTDSHTSLATTREENYWGKATPVEPNKHPDRFSEAIVEDRRENPDGSIRIEHWETLASGLAAVWAKGNTREALFDAMRRKEVYATTGTRMTVRAFAGWDFGPDEVQRPDFASTGYRRGVPMGGDLHNPPENAAPTIMVRALRDPDGANLDRVQIVKGWLDATGLHERVYDIAVSDGRPIGSDGRCRQPVGSTVDVGTASYTNTIGEPLMTAYWRDPRFDPREHAFYYVRVIEIPTPSWQAHDAKFYKLSPDRKIPMMTQERAYTSPIWYSPTD